MSDHQQPEERAIASIHSCAAPESDAWKFVIRPVTIFQVLHAETSPIFEDKSLVIEGRGFSAVTLVAHVTSVEVHPGRAVFILEDGTGRICAEKSFNSLNFIRQHGLSSDLDEEETTQFKAFEHTYVEVTGIPQKGHLKWGPRIQIRSIYPVHGYDQVMYHILNVIHSNRLIQHNIQPYSSNMNSGFNNIMESDISLDNHIPHVSASPAIFSNTFSPQKQQPYAAFEPLGRAIMMYMHHNRNHLVLISEMAEAIQASYGYTKSQFDLAIQDLLSEAYITSPLDDGYVILTPRP